MQLWLALLLMLAVAPAAAEVALSGSLSQGGLVIAKVEPGVKVELDGRPLRLAPDGSFVFGFGRDADAGAVLTLIWPDGRRENQTLHIVKRTYAVQRIDGLPPEQVTPPAEVLARIRAENARIAEARQTDTPEPWFRSGWIWPVDGIVTGVYGSQRILNGEPRQPHYGIDIAAAEGELVRATTDGRVLLAEPDLYYTGGTVIVDHGFGVTAAYSHLRDVKVTPGQMLRQGDILGTVGATGRATGAHLDWRVNWFEQRLDPELLLPPRN